LQPGDRVCIVSPASPPSRDGVAAGVEMLSSWGLDVVVAPHAFDEHGGFLAGSDENRACDLNDAFRDPMVRAVFASRGGKGAYRIVDRIDFGAVRADPKLLVGFSEITILHLAVLQRSRVPGIHGPMVDWNADFFGRSSADALRRAVMTSDAIEVASDADEPTSVLTTRGRASGPLIGGNLDMLRTAHGSYLPGLAGAILFIEDAVGDEIGRVDRSLHQLRNAGLLTDVAGVAVGRFGAGETVRRPGRWTVTDVVHDQLARLGVPVLGGLPLGHGPHPATVPMGTMATLDADAGTLTVDAAAR
jgi:muramoyltetrapeptide carboxypeptidase